MKPRKFNFSDVLMNVPKVVEETKISITAGGQMIIPRETYTKFGIEGAAVKVTYDPQKRALALKRIFSDFTNPDWDKKTMRLLQVNTANKKIRVPLGKLLKTLGLGGVAYNSIAMDKYHDQVETRDYYYVILPKHDAALPTT